MSELTPEAVALLEAARQGHGPSDNDRKRVLATLHASLGIGVPIALLPAAAEALASGQGAAQAAASAAQGGSAALQAAGSAAHGVGASTAAQGAGASALAAGHTAKGALSLAGKLLTWKAGKLLLASVALSSAVGIGVSVAPRRAPDAQPQLAGKSGQAAAFATDRSSVQEEPRAATQTDAGKSSLPSPLPVPAPDRERTAVASAPVPAAEPDATRALEPTEPALAHEAAPVFASRTTSVPHAKHAKYAGARSHRRSSAPARAEPHVAARAATQVRASVVAPSAADKSAGEAPPTQPIAAPVGPSPAVEVEAPNELALIRRALTSLRDRDANRALALLEEHATRFPSGSFATERRGLRVVALCAAGRVADGRREQAAFLKYAGDSPIAARVRGACTEHDD